MPAAIRGDPGRIRQVLTNLLGNAIKFTEEDEVVIRVELIENETEARIRLSVTDTGIGMTEEQRGRLFQAFSQAAAIMDSLGAEEAVNLDGGGSTTLGERLVTRPSDATGERPIGEAVVLLR